MPGEGELLAVVDTTDALSLGLRLRQSRQEHPGQNGNDGDDHQEFDEGEATTAHRTTTGYFRGFHKAFGEAYPSRRG